MSGIIKRVTVQLSEALRRDVSLRAFFAKQSFLDCFVAIAPRNDKVLVRAELLPKRGFSLLELMITVVILSIGIVAILRSFLSITYALDLTSNRVKAIQHLESAMGQLAEQAIREKELLPCETQKEILLGRRQAIEKTKVVLLKDSEEDLNEASITLSWCQSGNREQSVILTTYVQNKKE